LEPFLLEEILKAYPGGRDRGHEIANGKSDSVIVAAVQATSAPARSLSPCESRLIVASNSTAAPRMAPPRVGIHGVTDPAFAWAPQAPLGQHCLLLTDPERRCLSCRAGSMYDLVLGMAYTWWKRALTRDLYALTIIGLFRRMA
jgi:hypothetical protein